ncbi:response regulator transcription factor [Natranaerofaba carboxydovora]|uniref:response regulator transcription factor n=1 Tax=Natranaerofaba carboxydovora TaxID=2742683 RepID=UPI001F13BB0A|nr:response regulator transcription factor [Natranaerofaba carboxydovora]UMZ74640.1 Transcriptional regulatory protein SrrA [Natranaerofaba carboxydovora]
MIEDNYNYRILIIEDEKGLVKVLKAYLEKEGYEVFYSHDGEEGLKLFYEKNPDLIVLDLMLPSMSGENIAKKLRQTDNTPIIMLTAKGEEEEKLEGLGIGADDYVVKPASPREITARVKTILRRSEKDQGRVQKDIIETKNLTINTLSHRVYLKLDKADEKDESSLEFEELSLTPTEYEILKQLALYPKRVFSREDLADIVFGYFWEGDPRTVDTHIKNLRKKIEPDPKKPTFIKTVFGAGYQFQE